jgi:hypothetical protein
MPNWVYNTLTISGEPEQVKEFADKASKPRLVSTNYGKTIEPDPTPDQLSFWNFVAPPEKKYDLYFAIADGTEDKTWGWYNWNNSNWGCKWDASDVSMSPEKATEHTGSVIYYFSTPWSYPEPVLVAMAEQHPDLHFHLRSVEEQGWGVEMSGADGKIYNDTSWEIPSSHKDWVDTDQEGSCVCASYDDEDEWYKDCPRDEQEFILVIQKSYRVRTNTAENAYELITEQDNDPDEQMELLGDETLIWVLDENKQRVYPKL